MQVINTNIKQSLFLSLGTGLNSVLGLIFYLVVARSLGIAGFGYFSFLLGFSFLASELADFGFGSALIKFGSQDRFPAIFTLSALGRLLAAALLLIIFSTGSLFSDKNLILSAVGAISLLLASLFTQSLNTRQAYSAFVGASISGNLVRLVLTLYLGMPGSLSPEVAMWLFSVGALFTAGIGLAVLVRSFRSNLLDINGAGKIWPEVFRFNRFIAGSFGLSSLAAKLDIPLLYSLAGPVATGAYSGAQKLSSVIPQFISGLETVFSPKLSLGKSPNKDFKDYLILAMVSAATMLLFIPVAGQVIELFFGNKYHDSIFLFQIFLLGLALFALSGPFTSTVLYRYGKSNFHFFGSLGQLAVSLLLFLLLIPGFGAAGAAMAFVGAQCFNLLYYLFVWHHVHHNS